MTSASTRSAYRCTLHRELDGGERANRYVNGDADRVWLANASSNSGYVEEIVNALTDVSACCELFVPRGAETDGIGELSDLNNYVNLGVAKIEICQGEGRFHLQ